MKAFYTSKLLPNLAIGLLLFVMLTTIAPEIHAGSNNAAFIITTVDNIKGQYTMLIFQSVCTSAAYEGYDYVLLNGSDQMYDKACICEKYDQFYASQQSPADYKHKFWTIVKPCEVPFVIKEFDTPYQGDIKGYINDPEGNRDLSTKFTVNETGNLEMTADFTIYPNPAQDYFILDYQINEGDRMTLNVYDALGKEVHFFNNQLNQESGTHSITYDISDLMGGVYFYIISINDEKKSGRLIISK